MERIFYREIVEFNFAVNSLKSLRGLYRQSCNINTVLVEGNSGLRSNLDIVEKFYGRHLVSIPPFDDIVSKIRELISFIEPEDMENGCFSKDKYKSIILELCTRIEQLDVETNNLFSVLSLFKFYNFTFQPDTLLYTVNSMYRPEVWDFIPEQSKCDISEGAKGLLVYIPTGSAFLFLRALEGCIRFLCHSIDVNNGELMFGQAIDFLDKFFSDIHLEKKDKEFIERQINFLRYIKNEFRNPSAHPEKSFDQQESEQLFQVVNVAINRIYELYCLSESLKS
ncbi:MAG: hypothetical protein ACOX3L_07635 [Lutisporaceae bacterium]|jgi:hypothetical protein